jgi:hypothetical protein
MWVPSAAARTPGPQIRCGSNATYALIMSVEAARTRGRCSVLSWSMRHGRLAYLKEFIELPSGASGRVAGLVNELVRSRGQASITQERLARLGCQIPRYQGFTVIRERQRARDEHLARLERVGNLAESVDFELSTVYRQSQPCERGSSSRCSRAMSQSRRITSTSPCSRAMVPSRSSRDTSGDGLSSSTTNLRSRRTNDCDRPPRLESYLQAHLTAERIGDSGPGRAASFCPTHAAIRCSRGPLIQRAVFHVGCGLHPVYAPADSYGCATVNILTQLGDNGTGWRWRPFHDSVPFRGD